MAWFLPKNSSRQIQKVQQIYLAYVGPYWNNILIILLFGSKSVLFSCYLFDINPTTLTPPHPPIFGWKIESFQQFFGNEVSNSVEFFLWIPTKVSRLWALWFWNCIDFFALHGGFLHITSFIIGMLQALFFRKFRGGGCMGVCAKFFN